jgi:hypothetical protein
MSPRSRSTPLPLEQRIHIIRGVSVMLDADLASLYGVTPGALMQAVRRNAERFPSDFIFQLNNQELTRLKSQIVISNVRPGRGGRRSLPYAFTEQGVAMLSSVLRSPRAVQVNIAIMRTFVQLRQMLASSAELSGKLAALESKYDKQFKVVFDAIRELMSDKKLPRREIGFHTAMPKPGKVNGARLKARKFVNQKS